MEDYRSMNELAEMYEKDAVFYSEVSGDLGTASAQMRGSIEEINGSVAAVAALVGEIADHMQDMKKTAEDSDENSKAVLGEMEELSRLSEILNQTVASFKV